MPISHWNFKLTPVLRSLIFVNFIRQLFIFFKLLQCFHEIIKSCFISRVAEIQNKNLFCFYFFILVSISIYTLGSPFPLYCARLHWVIMVVITCSWDPSLNLFGVNYVMFSHYCVGCLDPRGRCHLCCRAKTVSRYGYSEGTNNIHLVPLTSTWL